MKELIKQAQNGDERAVNHLVSLLWTRIERMAGYYANRCREDSGDLMQEAWLGALDALKNVDMETGDPRQYLLKHAKWRILDYLKWSRRRRHEPIEDLELLWLEDMESDTIAHADCSEFLNQLSVKQRELLEYLLTGDTWREAAGKLGCTSANVAYYMRQIRQAYLRWAADDSALAFSGTQSIQPLAERETALTTFRGGE